MTIPSRWIFKVYNMFGKFFQKDKDGSDLKLADYKSIWTKFCFLDESGSLNDSKDLFFTVGFIKCSQPYYLQSKIIYDTKGIKGIFLMS